MPHEVISQMLDEYNPRNQDEQENVMKEILQELVLLALSKSDFFEKAAFYGGTALRIFYDLPRFSEDLDFSLIRPDPSFALKDYVSIIAQQLQDFGISAEVKYKAKTKQSAVQSAFVKSGTEQLYLTFFNESIHLENGRKLTVKFEIDTNPPEDARYDERFRLSPFPHMVKLYDAPSLFAGKLHALLCRGWKNRIKGRDLFDYVFYLQHHIPVHLKHLEQRMRQSGHLSANESLTAVNLIERLNSFFDSVDYDQAKTDVVDFITDPLAAKSLDIWSPEFFKSITRNLIIDE